MAICLPWHPLQPSKTQCLFRIRNPVHVVPIRQVAYVHAFRRSDFDGFARRVKSGEAWRDAWRSANDGFEQFVFETKKTAERIDRRYAVSRRLSAVAQSAADRARELDRDFEITQKWRTFSLDFSRNWPRYRKQLSDFMDTPLGRSAATIFFLWFALSGWLFRILIIATWVLPFAGPLLIGAVANNLVIKEGVVFRERSKKKKGTVDSLTVGWRGGLCLFSIMGQCPACRRQFIGNKNSTVRCASCGNIVWQPKGGDFFSRGSRGTTRSKSEPDIIDVEFEEK